MSQIGISGLTVGEVISSAEQALIFHAVSFGHGTNNAFDEAVWLVLWRLGLPLDELEYVKNKPLAPSDKEKIATLLIARVETRKPAAYLTQEAWLQGVAFYVDERVIVPRSLIAELLVNPLYSPALDYWINPQTHAVLDLCTGNGSLAILAALSFPEVVVTGADISEDALAVAAINVEKHHLQDRITLNQSDGLNALTGKFDLILCNPPYVNANSMAQLPPEFRAEPRIALDGNVSGGTDGMDFIRTLLQHIAPFMSEQSVLVLEIGNERDHFEAAFGSLDVVWLETSAGDDQVLLITRKALSR
jgi:ribosomal protein L3 glutamine methyltransferase